MRLLRSYCNREGATARLAKLRARTSAERVPRPSAPIEISSPARKRLSAEVNAAIVADYTANMPVRAIARKYGANECTVHHRLKKAGVTKRPYAIQPDVVEEVLRLHTKGRTNVAIAHLVGISESSVHNVLGRHERDRQ